MGWSGDASLAVILGNEHGGHSRASKFGWRVGNAEMLNFCMLQKLQVLLLLWLLLSLLRLC